MKSSRVLLKSVNYTISTAFIKNVDTPICMNCVHFVPDNITTVSHGKCNQFGSKNMVTGNITYNFAQECRENEYMCGKHGNYYKELPDPRERVDIKPTYVGKK